MQKVTRVLGATGVEALAEESSGGEPGRNGRGVRERGQVAAGADADDADPQFP